MCLSCGDIKSDNIKLKGVPHRLNDNIVLYLPAGSSDQEVALLMEAAKVHTDRFEQDWGKPVRPLNIDVFKIDVLTKCGETNGTFSGCHYSPSGPVHVITGTLYEIPALYHEYVHHMISGNDSNHTDPRWQSFWDPINGSIVAGLRAERANLDIQ